MNSKIINILGALSKEEYFKERSKRRDIERWIENIINSSIDISKWVRFRNIIAHEYLDIRWNSIKKFIQETEVLYKNFR